MDSTYFPISWIPRIKSGRSTSHSLDSHLSVDFTHQFSGGVDDDDDDDGFHFYSSSQAVYGLCGYLSDAHMWVTLNLI